MDANLRHALTKLNSSEVLPIRDGEGRTVVVFRGLLWITQEGDRRDVFLRSGQSFTIDRPGVTLIEALGDSSLLVLDPDQPSADGAAAQSVLIRPLRPDDAQRLDRLVRGLSPIARQRRFHAAVNELAPAWLDRLVRVRVPREAALLATVRTGDDEQAVGEARYGEAEGAPEAREFALLVDDRWQHRGLGTRLLGALVRLAERSGARRLYGDVLRDNAPMLALARRLGFTLQMHPDDGRLTRMSRSLDARNGKPFLLAQGAMQP